MAERYLIALAIAATIVAIVFAYAVRMKAASDKYLHDCVSECAAALEKMRASTSAEQYIDAELPDDFPRPSADALRAMMMGRMLLVRWHVWVLLIFLFCISVAAALP